MRTIVTSFVAAALCGSAAIAMAEDCEKEFSSTFDAIQEVIFENRGCVSTNCHVGPTPAGGLDLSDADTSYANLVDQPVQSVSTDQRPKLKRVLPAAQVGGKSDSLLWLNLASAVLPEL